MTAVPKESWWLWYEQYLKTPDWQFKRAAVLQRCNGVCEGCGVGAAVEVHHTTYAHVGHEMLFELRGMCESCHDLITKLDREKRRRVK